jgi:hypothetical protein
VLGFVLRGFNRSWSEPWVVVAVLSTAVVLAWAARRRSSSIAALGAAAALFWTVNAATVGAEPAMYRLATYDHQYTIAQIANYYEGARPDVIFMGSSVVGTGLDPQVAEAEVAAGTGRTIRALNLGTSAGGVGTSYLMLKNLISRAKQPRVIVVGVALGDVTRPDSDNRLIPYVSTMARSGDREFAEPGRMGAVRFLLGQLLPVYRDAPLLRAALAIRFNPNNPAHRAYEPRRSRWRWDPRGYHALPGHNPEALETELELWRGYLRETAKFTSHRLEALVRLAQRRGIDVVIVRVPDRSDFRSLRASFDQPIKPRFDAAVRRLAGPRVRMLDFYDAIPDHLFHDVHLNADGAATFTRLVAAQGLVPIFARTR